MWQNGDGAQEMSLRSATIYVEPKTVKRLLTLAKLYPERVIDLTGGLARAPREKTADERADALLNEVIREKYPKVIELEREVARVETAFFERVKVASNK